MANIPTPATLLQRLPASAQALATISSSKQVVKSILNGHDDRLLIIIGPCSIHNPDAAIHYAEKLRQKMIEHQDSLCIVMRAYIEKSRTALGWKGFVNDPNLNNTFQIEKGLTQARQLFVALNEMNVPLATEIIHPYVFQYVSDLVSWAAIGARSTESQLHREFVSSLDIPVGFKNNTNGDIQVAIDAVKTAQQPHQFFSPDVFGVMQLQQSTGNPDSHIVLRGSKQSSNYDKKSIAYANTISKVIIDCSHGNSGNDYRNQLTVAKKLSMELKTIAGLMIESNLTAGKQHWNPSLSPDSHQSITDACIGWDDTEALLDYLSEKVRIRQRTLIE